MRIVTSNAVDSAATLSATNASASLPASNLGLEGKTRILRAGANTTQIKIDWTANQAVGCIALPWVNLSSSATWRVQLFSDQAGTVSVHDSGTISTGIFPQPSLAGMPANANAFVYGCAGSAAYWLAAQRSDVRCVRIDLTDTSKSFIDVARVVVGPYWQPQYQVDVGAQIAMVDLSATDRNQSGDARVKRGARFKTLQCDLSMMQAVDRKALWDLVRSHGATAPLFVSVLPTGAIDSDEQAMLHLYGKFVQPATLSYATYNAYNATLDFEEM